MRFLSLATASKRSSAAPGATSGPAIRGRKPESLIEQLTQIAIVALCAFSLAVAWMALVDLVEMVWRWL